MTDPQDPADPTPSPPPGAEHLAGAAEPQGTEALRARLQAALPDHQLLSCLGRGGMGAVFRAQHLRLDRPVAVKALLPAPDAALGWEERFLREARALARLAHPGIVAVHDYGRADDLAWIVMEFVDGASLRELMSDGRLSPSEALAIVPQVCQALQYAHDRGVVHRDVKPENILLDEAGRVRIADFGLAKLMDAGTSARLTGSAQAMGTLRYMAPEQLERPREVDHRADIFSLGVVLYEMLTGQVPAGSVSLPSASGCEDERLDEVVMRSMEREPDRRYQRASEVGERLEELRADGAPGPGPTAGAATPPGPRTEDVPLRRRLRHASLAVVVLGLVSLLVGWGNGPSGPYNGFENPMGLMTAATLVGIGVALFVLGEHGRGMTAGWCQLALAPLAVLLPFIHEANTFHGWQFQGAITAAGVGAILLLLGALQVGVREPDEVPLREDLARARARLAALDLWPWLCALPPALALFMFTTNAGRRFMAVAEAQSLWTMLGFAVAMIAPPAMRRSTQQRRLAACLSIALAAPLVVFSATVSESSVGEPFAVMAVITAVLALAWLAHGWWRPSS